MTDKNFKVTESLFLQSLALLISFLLLFSACGSENTSAEETLSKDMETKTGHDHGGHDHGGHDHGGHGDHSGEEFEVPDVSFEVEVVEGKVKGGLPRFEVSKGDLIEITVYSDQKDEVHLHVYDNMADVGPNYPAVITVEASIPGIFEAELHSAGFRIFELQVS
ncbi:MAG: hypothetical protein MKZ69_00415 [Acidimicrobiales bacterium]|nr:hypothetical protein [Acidimicrobiales bacterium]